MSAPHTTGGHQQGQPPVAAHGQAPIGQVPVQAQHSAGVQPEVVQLPPFPKPLGILQAYIAQRPEAAVLKEGGVRGDNFDITNLAGQPLFIVTANKLSTSQRKEFRLPGPPDAPKTKGDLLFTIRQKHIALHTTYLVEDKDGKDLCEVKNHMSLSGTESSITFTGLDGQPAELALKGSWLENAQITDASSGAPVADIKRDTSASSKNIGRELIGRQSYTVSVAPGVDQALMYAICICLDEKNEPKN